MYIRCWGSRGSVPVSGKEYIKYGGDTTCIEIRTSSGEIVIVDAGTGIRKLGNLLLAEERHQCHLIFTHAHWDHIMGFPFFRPLYRKYVDLRVYRSPIPSFAKKMLSTIMTPPYFPIPYDEIKANITYADEIEYASRFGIGSLSVWPIALSHPNTGRGFKFMDEGKTFVFLTDNELGFDHPQRLPYQSYVDFARGADLLVHDAEYTPDQYSKMITWGHSTYMDALNLALDADVKRLGLFHLNQDRTDSEMDDIVDKCRTIIAERGSGMDCFAVSSDMDLSI